MKPLTDKLTPERILQEVNKFAIQGENNESALVYIEDLEYILKELNALTAEDEVEQITNELEQCLNDTLTAGGQ